MSLDIKNDIANEALRVVNGARREAYGKPEKNFERIALFWAAYFENLGVDMTVEEGGGASPFLIEAKHIPPLMRLMKEARLCESPDHRDSYVDLVGYALCGAEVAGVSVAEAPGPAEQPKFKVGDQVRWLGRFEASTLTKDKVYTIMSAPKFTGGMFGVTDDEQDTGAHSWSEELLAKNFELVKTEPAEADGWIEWAGGERPVRGYTWVDYKIRNGDRGRDKAGTLSWEIRDTATDIVAYRVVTP